MSSETYLNASQAKDLLGVSMPTLKKWIKANAFPNATQRPKGKVMVWEIPLSDLHNSGKLDRVSNASKTEQTELRTTALEVTIDNLNRELIHARELLGLAREQIEELRADKAQLYARLPVEIETKEAQDRRRFYWFRRNP